MDKPEWTFWPTQHIWNLLRKHIWSILTGRKKKSRQLCEVTISIWSSHCTLWIDTILILNYLPIKVSIRRVWHPSNRRRVSRVCAPALWPRYSLWRLHHWIGVQLSSHQGCPPCELLPSRKTASLSVCTLCMYSYMSVSCRADTRSSAGVSIVCAQSQLSTLRCQNSSLKSVLPRVYTPRELAHWRLYTHGRLLELSVPYAL